MTVIKFLKSFRYAFEGILAALHERNFRVHIIAMVVVIVVAYFTGLTKIEWLLIAITIALMLALEMMNTAIEKVVDLVSPECHPLAKAAKDVAAGAVLIFAITSVIIGLAIFLPKWL